MPYASSVGSRHASNASRQALEGPRQRLKGSSQALWAQHKLWGVKRKVQRGKTDSQGTKEGGGGGNES